MSTVSSEETDVQQNTTFAVKKIKVYILIDIFFNLFRTFHLL